MLTELLNVVPYVLSLAALSALLLWALPMLFITAASHVKRDLKALGCQPTRAKARSEIWPRFSDPA